MAIKELVVISGKGGTGKTSLTAAFAALSKNSVICDADVDAADLHLLLTPTEIRRTVFKTGNRAIIDRKKCTECGQCIDLCRFDAIDRTYSIDHTACEGCGVCVDLCPEKAIDFPEKTCGEWFISNTRFGPMVHARLGIAEENSGRLVSLVRSEARDYAETHGQDLIITDGPPGVGCPVIASIGGASALCIVTEPTVSGIHDMERVMTLARHFNVPPMVIINKSDLNHDMTRAIDALCTERHVPVLGRIPFDPVFTRAMIQGKTIVEFSRDDTTCQTVKHIWEKISLLYLTHDRQRDSKNNFIKSYQIKELKP
jgi:MinD superfamily P-loop ATPase